MRSGWRGNSRRKERRSSGRALAPQRADLKACSYDNAMTTYEELRAKAQAAWQPFAEPRRPLITGGGTTCCRGGGARWGRPPGRPGVLYGNLTADKAPSLIESALVAGGAAPALALAVLADEPFGG